MGLGEDGIFHRPVSAIIRGITVGTLLLVNIRPHGRMIIMEGFGKPNMRVRSSRATVKGWKNRAADSLFATATLNSSFPTTRSIGVYMCVCFFLLFLSFFFFP